MPENRILGGGPVSSCMPARGIWWPGVKLHASKGNMVTPDDILLKASGALTNDRPDDAIDLLQQGLASFPDHLEMLHILGLAEWGKGHISEARHALERATDLAPDNIPVRVSLSNIYLAIGKADAVVSLLSGPENVVLSHIVVAQINLARAYEALGRIDESLATFQHVLTLDPADMVNYLNLARLLEKTGQRDDALNILKVLVIELPTRPEPFIQLCAFFSHARRYDDVIATADQGLNQAGAWAEISAAKANATQKQGRFADAKNLYADALKMQTLVPQTDAQIRHALGSLMLLMGDGEEGWPLFEARLSYTASWWTSSLPWWQGAPLPSGRLLLQAEGNSVAALQMMRFLPLVSVLVPDGLVLDIPREMDWLYSTYMPEGQIEILPDHAPIPEDCRAMAGLMSLPLLLGQVDRIPPLLSLAPNSREIDPAYEGKIGLYWGRSGIVGGVEGLVPAMSALAEADQSFVALANEEAAVLPFDMELFLWGKNGSQDAESLEALISVVASLDRVITVDGVVAHLAGILGKECWLLLPVDPDWVWGLDQDVSDWYPTIRLFRQTEVDNWSSVIQQVCVELSA